MAWTNVSKPGAQTWTANNPVGKEQYDDSLVTYDSTSTYYDGINPAQWTDVSKPSAGSWTNVAKPT